MGAFELDTITCMDALAFARTLPDESVHCVVTSVPYWGLRDYGMSGQMGLEDSFREWLRGQVELFREIRRVMRHDAVLWLNCGDAYASSANGRSAADTKAAGNDDRTFRDKPFSTVGDGLKAKDLLMMPAELAIALRNDGYYLRSEIVWHKPNPMPESARDRPTKAHEMVYLLTKAPRYWYDQEAIREPSINAGEVVSLGDKSFSKGQAAGAGIAPSGNGLSDTYTVPVGRNKRTVWTVATEPFGGSHFAVFPQALIEPMILAGCPARVCSVCGAPWERVVERIGKSLPVEERYGRQGHNGSPPQQSGWFWNGPVTQSTGEFRSTCDHDAPTDAGVVFDPFMGAGTTGLVAMRLGRHYIGSELNAEYVALAQERIAQADPYQPKAYDDGVTQLSLFAQEDEA